MMAFATGLHRFHVYHPVANHLIGAGEILLRELVDGPRAVFVARVFAIKENAFCHCAVIRR
jgi:hypothetical protein